MANWTPEGFIGQVFKTLGKHLPPPAGVMSPALWGTKVRLAELFDAQALSIEEKPRDFIFRYRSANHWVEIFKTWYGPLVKAFAVLEPTAQSALEADLIALIARFNRSGGTSMVVPSEYLEVIVTRR